MLKNVVDYLNYKENSRANRVREVETERHNRFGETETYRHNVATEQVESGKLQETRRHNVASEGIEHGKLDEMHRHNVAGEDLEGRKLAELNRHNTVQESQGWVDLNQTEGLRAAQTKAAEAQARAASAQATASIAAANLSDAKTLTESKLRSPTIRRAVAEANIVRKDDRYYHWNNAGAGISRSAIAALPGILKLFK